MAYGDYGGYSYKNNERIPEKSDVSFSNGNGEFHAVLGDGDVEIGLYKQGFVSVRIGDSEIDFFDGESVEFKVGDIQVEIAWVHDDNYYCYARLTVSPDEVWTGFSGYGVGAGLEGCGYGFSTKQREADMKEHWAHMGDR